MSKIPQVLYHRELFKNTLLELEIYERSNILLTSAEVNTLLKLLNYIKFTCEDEEANIFKGSPFINSIFEKILKENPIPLHQSKQRQKEILENIEKRLEQKDYYKGLSTEEKREYLSALLFPYPLD